MMTGPKQWMSVCLIVCWFTNFAAGADISLVSKHTCSKAENNRLKFEINLYDVNAVSTGIKALNATDSEIDTCTITGTGREASPYNVVSYVYMANNSETNACGIRVSTVNNEVLYTWHLRASRTSSGTFQGFIMNATCSRDNITDGEVQTQTRFDIPSFFVSARFSENITGANTFATDSDLTLTAIFYPDGFNVPQALSNAKGIYLKNCYSGTDPSVTQNRQLFVDTNGCPVSGATFEASNPPQKRAGSGTSPVIVDLSFFRARTVANLTTIYVQCGVGKCTQDNDPGCINHCLTTQPGQTASPSGVDAGIQFNTSFSVQDVAAQQLIAATTADQNTPIDAVTSGTPIRIISRHSPFGTTGGVTIDPRLRSAVGFYVSSCSYSLSSSFINPVQFVNSSGCSIPGTLLTQNGEFMFTSLENNVYTVTSGIITPTVQTVNRVIVRCNTGICTQAGHDYCVNKRCGGTNNITGAAIDLGFNGLEFPLTITNPATTNAVNFQFTNTNGQSLAGTAPVTVGDPLSLSIVVNPDGGGQGSGQFDNGVEGIFVTNCFVSEVPDPTTEAQKIYFIDENGCRIPDSPYSTSQNCVLENEIPGVPPFIVNCGTFTTPNAGTLYQFCSLGACFTPNNINCIDRCAAGVLNPGENAALLDSTFSRVFQVEARDDRRTAVRANEIVTTIIAVTVVAPVVVIICVSVITYFVVNAQRPKN